MVLKNGYIKLWRSLADWEWYKDWKTTRLFVHLLITANYEDGTWQNIEVKRGQRVTSVAKLSEETGLSSKEIRGILDRLKKTNELAIKTTNKYTIITIEKYEFYQSDIEKRANKTANNGADKGQAEGQQRKKERNKEYIYTPEFEEFYSQYPRSGEKRRTFTNWNTAIKTCTADELIKAAQNYNSAVKGREKDFIKTSANFLGKEKIYLDYIVNETKPERKPVFFEEDEG